MMVGVVLQMVRVIVVVFERDPEVPVTVTVYAPETAVLPTTKESVLEVLVLAGLKVAVTPLGTPEATRLTVPLKPFTAATEIVELPVFPRATVRAVGELESMNEAGVVWLRSLISDCPAGDPQPVARSYPVTAE